VSAAVALRPLERIDEATLPQLVDLLVATVDDGASIGFLPPLAPAEAEAYWRGVLGHGVLLWVAERDGRIVGSAQLHLCLRQNGLHRAEVAKLMVHPDARRQGIARRLMEAVESAARRHERSLLILDTREGDPSNDLYRSLGYLEFGRAPRYARSGDGGLDASVFYYKEL
jgi:ribosomal protein S18 acetylase RimI-like enzyme